MSKSVQFVLLFILFSIVGYPQDEASLKPYLNANDIEKLGKAEKIKTDGDRQMAEFKDLNIKIQALKRDTSLSTRKIKNQTNDLQARAWQKHVQASAAYEKSNEIKYEIYRKYLNNFWTDHEGQEANYINAKMLEEQARDNYSQAAVYRRNTRHMNLGNVKEEKLTEANNLEAAAIRRQVASLSSCLGVSASVTETAASTPSEADPAPGITNPAPVSAAPAAVIAAPLVMEPPAMDPGEKSDVLPAARDTSFDNQVLFRVQIAANKVPFTFTDLNKICPSNYPVEMVSEAGWYKYQFFGVPMFSDASRILKEAAVKDAFVVAYNKSGKQNISEAVKNNRMLEKRIQAEGKNGLIQEIQYHVVLATSKTFLKPEEVAKLYHGTEPVRVVMENGLYAYHLNAGYSLQNALDLKELSGLKSATVVAYKNAKKAVTGGTL